MTEEERRAKQAEYNRKWVKENPEKVKAVKQAWKDRNPNYKPVIMPEQRRKYVRKHLLKKNYGLTVQQYDKMVEDQNGLCAICEKPETTSSKGTVLSLCVDHCHETGEIRGLLCLRCNRSLHDINWHKKSIAYLERFSDA